MCAAALLLSFSGYVFAANFEADAEDNQNNCRSVSFAVEVETLMQELGIAGGIINRLCADTAGYVCCTSDTYADSVEIRQAEIDGADILYAEIGGLIFLADEMQIMLDGAVRYERSIPTSAFASVLPDYFAEDGTPIYYINISPDAWEWFYLYHPFFQYRLGLDPDKEAAFLVRDEFTDTVLFTEGVGARNNLCGWCGRWMLVLDQQFVNIRFSPVACFAVGGYSDHRFGDGWRWRERCNGCGRATPWAYTSDIFAMSWSMQCSNNGGTHRMLNGNNMRRGNSAHASYNITGNFIIHGFNCGCRNYNTTGNNCRWF